MAEETFGAYDITRAIGYLNLTTLYEWKLDWQPVEPSLFLQVGLEDAKRQITPGANEWEKRYYLEIVFMEALRGRNLKIWQEQQIDAGESPYRGKVDFAITAYQLLFQTPFVLIIEAKKENFDLGWGQCLMAIKSCQMLNERAGISIDLFGIVSTGMIWEFGRYTMANQFYKSDSYTLTQPATVLGLLDAIFTECEQNIVPA